MSVASTVQRGGGGEDPHLQRPHLLREPQLLQGGGEPSAGPDAGEDPQPRKDEKGPGETPERHHRQHRGTYSSGPTLCLSRSRATLCPSLVHI